MTDTGIDSSALRAERTYPALFRIAKRHAFTPEARARQVNARLLGPAEAVRLAAMLGAGAAAYLPEEPALDREDLGAALTLVPLVRSEIDELELSLLLVARRRGMTWSEIASGLGLASAQAAQQRHDRLAARTGSH